MTEKCFYDKLAELISDFLEEHHKPLPIGTKVRRKGQEEWLVITKISVTMLLSRPVWMYELHRIKKNGTPYKRACDTMDDTIPSHCDARKYYEIILPQT